jgi:hypothetical protein
MFKIIIATGNMYFFLSCAVKIHVVGTAAFGN